MDRVLVVVGGGEIRNRTTLEIDRAVAEMARGRAGERRAVATFVGAASHDSMPYFNSFRKTYTSIFDIKAEVCLSVYGEMDYDKMVSKLQMADCIYIGGGDTKFLMEHLRQKNLLLPIIEAYNRGVILVGLSAGGICWFQTLYSDYDIVAGKSGDYKILEGIGLLEGVVCPHYNHRKAEFDPLFEKMGYKTAYAIEDDAALVFINGSLSHSLTSGGSAYKLTSPNQNPPTKPIAKKIDPQ